MFQEMMPMSQGGGTEPLFSIIYSIVTRSIGDSGASVNYYAYDIEGNYIAGTVVDATSSSIYEDDNLKIDYMVSGGRTYFRFTLKVDALVNGVQQSAGYSTNWIYNSIKSYFIVV